MKNLVPLSVALLTLFLGVFLHLLDMPYVGRVTNVFWGSVYGFGAYLVADAGSSPYRWVGLLIYPLLVFLIVFLTASVVARRGDGTTQVVLLDLLSISALACISIETALSYEFSFLPLWFRYSPGLY